VLLPAEAKSTFAAVAVVIGVGRGGRACIGICDVPKAKPSGRCRRRKCDGTIIYVRACIRGCETARIVIRTRSEHSHTYESPLMRARYAAGRAGSAGDWAAAPHSALSGRNRTTADATAGGARRAIINVIHLPVRDSSGKLRELEMRELR